MQLFNKQKTESKQISVTGEIEVVQTEIQSKQGVLDELLVQQSELALLITEHQQQIETSAAQLEALQIQQAQEEREAQIASELQQLRPIANKVNGLTSELVSALDSYQQRAAQLREKLGLYNFIQLDDRRLTEFLLPEIKHSIGSQYFTLKARNITVKR